GAVACACAMKQLWRRTRGTVEPSTPLRRALVVTFAYTRLMPSFDVVSKVDLMELDNALNVARKELGTRYDFRGTSTDIERTPEGLTIRSSDEPHANAALTVLRERMAKR